MRKIIYLFFYTVVGVLFTSCEKGEKVTSFTPFTNLVVDNLASGYTMEINGRHLVSNHVKIETITGESSVVLFNEDQDIEFEGTFTIKPDTDTLVFFKINDDIPASLLRKEALNEPGEEGKLKLKIINANKEISELLEGEPFHLVLYQLMARSVRPPRTATYHEMGDTIKSITSTFPELYQSIDITDNNESNFGFSGRAQILKEDFTPLLFEEKPVFVSYDYLNMDLNTGQTHGVVIALIPNEAGLEVGNYPNLPLFWQYNKLEAFYRN